MIYLERTTEMSTINVELMTPAGAKPTTTEPLYACLQRRCGRMLCAP